MAGPEPSGVATLGLDSFAPGKPAHSLASHYSPTRPHPSALVALVHHSDDTSATTVLDGLRSTGGGAHHRTSQLGPLGSSITLPPSRSRMAGYHRSCLQCRAASRSRQRFPSAGAWMLAGPNACLARSWDLSPAPHGLCKIFMFYSKRMPCPHRVAYFWK